MAMNASLLASEIIAAVKGVNGDFTSTAEGEVTPELEAMCGAIIDHIIANAQLAVMTPNASGGMATLPGTGTVQS